MPSFVSALAEGQIQRADISRVEFFLHHKLKLSEHLSGWIAETWAIAFGFKFHEPKNSFRCPHCGLDGLCDNSWRDRLAMCPACNALLRFTSSLNISLEKRGWTKKRQKSRDWLLTNPEITHHDSSLRSAIVTAIQDEDLSSIQLAEHLGLDVIVGTLQTEVLTLLQMFFNKSVAIEENIVQAILRSALRQEYVCFDLDEDFPQPQYFYGTKETSDPNEKWLAVIGSSAKRPFHGLAFSNRSLHYGRETERWAVLYADLHRLPITLGKSITELKLGEHRSIDLKGLGIPRRVLQPALSLIGRFIYELSNAATDGSF
jgi:hypothetical protein